MADLEKAASGACGHFVVNHAILRTSRVKPPVFFTEDRGRRLEGEKLKIDKGELRLYDGENRIKNSEMRLEGFGLRIDNKDLRNQPCFTHI